MEPTPSQRLLVQAMADGLFETAPFGLSLFDPDLRFVRLNRFVTRLNRRSVKEHVGKRFGEARRPRLPRPAEDDHGEGAIGHRARRAQ